MRTLILWVVIIVVLVVLYDQFSEGHGRAFGPYLPVLFGGLFLAVFAFVFTRARGWSTRINTGVAHFNAGEFEAAARLFSEAAPRAGNKQQRALANMNLGHALLQMGKLDEALEQYQLADDSRGLVKVSVYHHSLPNQIATCHALRGNVETAKRMLEEGEKRRGKAPSNFTLLPEVLVLCREEHFAAAAAVIEKRWREAELAGGRQLKLVRILQAFALDCADPAGNAAAVAEALAAAKPVDPATVRLLTISWPRMRAFLEARQIRPEPAAG